MPLIERQIALFRADPERLMGTFWERARSSWDTQSPVIFMIGDFYGGQAILGAVGVPERFIRVPLSILLSPHGTYTYITDNLDWIRPGNLAIEMAEPHRLLKLWSRVGRSIIGTPLPTERWMCRLAYIWPNKYTLVEFLLAYREATPTEKLEHQRLLNLDMTAYSQILLTDLADPLYPEPVVEPEPEPPPPEEPVIGRSRWEVLDDEGTS